MSAVLELLLEPMRFVRLACFSYRLGGCVEPHIGHLVFESQERLFLRAEEMEVFAHFLRSGCERR
jgi:hypothetical protein